MKKIVILTVVFLCVGMGFQPAFGDDLKYEEKEEIINQFKVSGQTDIIITNIFDYLIEGPGFLITEGLKMTIKNIGYTTIEPWTYFEFRGDFEKIRFIFPNMHVDEVFYGYSSSKEILPGESFDIELTFGDEAYNFPFLGIYKVTASFWCSKDSNLDDNEYIEFYRGINFYKLPFSHDGFSWTEFPNLNPHQI